MFFKRKSLEERNERALMKDETLRLKAAYALNLCTVSVSQIIDYNDINILEQEYNAILNNLNIQNFIKDEVLLKILKQLLDTITFFRIQEKEKSFVEKEYQQKMKNAIWSAVPNLSIIFTGGNPVNMAIAAATQIGIGYMNYRKNKNQYQLEKERQDWELQRSAIEQFNGLRRELFETAWRLSDKYNFPDEYRLTESQITQYDAILMDPDPLRRYERLDVISDSFKAFPPYWYYKGNAAREITERYENNSAICNKYMELSLIAYNVFEEIYRKDMELMREDVIASSCFLEKIALLIKLPDKYEKGNVSTLLERAVRLAGNNLDVLQQCVFHYISLANQDTKYLSNLIQLLRYLVNEDYNLSINGRLLSRLYCKTQDKISYEILSDRIGANYIFPWVENDDEANEQYLIESNQYLGEKFSRFIELFKEKYELKFNKIIPYDFSNTKETDDFYRFEKVELRKANINKIFAKSRGGEHFIPRLNAIVPFIDLSNELFDEFYYSELFHLLYNRNDELLKEAFDILAIPMKKKVSEIEKIQDDIKSGDDKVKVLELMELVEFSNYTTTFFDEIMSDFRNRLTIDVLKSKDIGVSVIDGTLDRLYYDNDFEFTTDSLSTKLPYNKTMFFTQANTNEDKEELPKGKFPVYESNDQQKMIKIRRIIEEKRRELVKKEKYYKPYKRDNEKISAQVEKIRKKNIDICKHTLIAIADTSIFGGYDIGLWICYDGIYFLTYPWKVEYIDFSAIATMHLKKPEDKYSALIIDRVFNRGRYTYDDKGINKGVLIQIIEEIKEALKGG